MARPRKKGSPGSPPFVALPWDVLNSKAYQNLPPSAAKALPYFIGKVKLPFNDPTRNHTEFAFPYQEAARYGFAKATHFRNISALVRKGFINPRAKGGLRGDGKSASLFSLSSRWKEYGTRDFDHITWEEFV